MKRLKFLSNNYLFFLCLINSSILLSAGNTLAQVTEGVYYEIESALDASLVLDVDNGSTQAGTNLKVWSRNGSDAQKFQFIAAGNGYYLIGSKLRSDYVVDVNAANAAAGTNVHLWDQNMTNAQKFMLVDAGGGYYFIQSAIRGNYVLDVQNGQAAAGTNIQMWDLNRSKAQQFKLKQERSIPDRIIVTDTWLPLDENTKVCWENPTDENQLGRLWTQEAMAKSWSAFGKINFVGWRQCPSGAFNGIRIRVRDDSDGAYAKGLGREILGSADGMVLNFTFENWGKGYRTKGIEGGIKTIAVHEFGHALGFAHEHNRQDCLCDEKPQGTNGTLAITPCDANSIMNYCGPNDGLLSEFDITGVKDLYGARPLPPDAPLSYIKVTNNGAYKAYYSIEYQVPGYLNTVDVSDDVPTGGAYTFSVPSNAVAVLKGYCHTLSLAWGQMQSKVTGISFSGGGQTKNYESIGTILEPLLRDNASNGEYAEVGGNWGGTEAMTSLNGNLYAVQGGKLWRTDAQGKSTALASNWGGTESMTGMGGYFYAIQGGKLWKVDANGKYTDLGGGWTGTPVMASMGSYVYAFNGGKLWRTDSNGKSTDLGGGWTLPEAMTSHGSYLYVAQGGKLWRTDSSGKYTEMGGNWGGTAALASDGKYIYALQGGKLWRYDPGTKKSVALQTVQGSNVVDVSWSLPKTMVCMNGMLYIVQGGKLWKAKFY